MIRELFVCQKTIARLETGPLACYLENLAQYLASKRYTTKTIRTYLTLCDLFGRWLSSNEICTRDITDNVIQQFANAPSLRKKWRAAALAGVNALVGYLQSTGEIKPPEKADVKASDDIYCCLLAFDQHLERVQGLAKETRKHYRLYVRRFLVFQATDGKVNWSAVTATEIGRFLANHAVQHPGSNAPLVTALRSFVRFLVSQDILPVAMTTVIPISKRPIHSALPNRLAENEFQRLLSEAKNDTSPIGVRNYVIILLLTRLALRANEVITLKLEDIDWTKGVLYVRSLKGRERVLPLAKDLAEALLLYLKEYRPRTCHREIFITHNAPYRPIEQSAAICKVVRILFTAAGIDRLRGAAHLIRHTVASKLINSGVSFKDTADFLGHQFLQTTGIYAKLDLESLQQIAMPWPGGAR